MSRGAGAETDVDRSQFASDFTGERRLSGSSADERGPASAGGSERLFDNRRLLPQAPIMAPKRSYESFGRWLAAGRTLPSMLKKPTQSRLALRNFLAHGGGARWGNAQRFREIERELSAL